MRVTIRGNRQPRPASRIAPAAGKRRIRSATWLLLMGFSSLQLAEVIDIFDVAMPEDVDQDRQPDHPLSGGYGHRHERKQLAVEVLELTREGDQGEVRRVEHELDEDEDDQRVATVEDADRAEDEEHSGEQQEPGGVELRAAGVEPAHYRSSPSLRLR